MFGVIGFFVLAWFIICKMINAAKDGIAAGKSQTCYGLVYMGQDNHWHSSKTYEIVFSTKVDGDKVWKNRRGRIVVNESAIRRELETQQAIKGGRKYILYQNNGRYPGGELYNKYLKIYNHDTYPSGPWYQNIDTGKLYVVRQFEWQLFYLEIETGKIIDWTEGEYKLYNTAKENGLLDKVKKYRISKQEIIDKYQRNELYKGMPFVYTQSPSREYTEERFNEQLEKMKAGKL